MWVMQEGRAIGSWQSQGWESAENVAARDPRDQRTIEWNPGQPNGGVLPTWGGQSQEDSGNRVACVWFDAWDRHPPEPPDVYCRPSDLIATYRQGAGDRLTCQLEWQLVPLGSYGHGVDLLLSSQTELLDARPAVTVSTHLHVASVWTARGDTHKDELSRWTRVSFGRPVHVYAAMLVRLPGAYSYVEVVHPMDSYTEGTAAVGQSQIECFESPTPSVRSRVRFFGDALEKGVIRRARWRCAWVPREDDEYFAAVTYADLLRRALPLTT